MIWSNVVAAATVADLTATFAAGTTPSGDTLTAGANGVFAVDGYTASLGDRILVKDQTTGTQNGIYTVTTLGSLASGVGPIATVAAPVAGSGYVTGTYTVVQLTGGTGTGAKATVVASGTGPAYAIGAITPGSLYHDGEYVNVPLTGGTGTGAKARFVIQQGAVLYCTLTVAGTGYAVGDVLSASNTNFGSVGSGFSIPVTQVLGHVSAVTITTPGTGYTVGDVLTINGLYFPAQSGSGASAAVATVVPSAAVLTRSNDSVNGYQIAGETLFVGAGTVNVQTAWVQVVAPVIVNTTALVYDKFVG
jgi:hypothetical protein